MRARENPFRTDRIGRLAFRHPVFSVDALHARWLALGARGAIVGPQGSGKTTLLRELGEGLEERGLRVRRWFLNADVPAPPTRNLVREARTLTARDVLLIDGAGHLSRTTWWRLTRAARGAGGLLVTAHAGGLLPTLLETRSDLALLAVLTDELLGRPVPSLRPLLAELYARHRGNLRDVLLALYDLAAGGDPRLCDAPPRRDSFPAPRRARMEPPARGRRPRSLPEVPPCR